MRRKHQRDRAFPPAGVPAAVGQHPALRAAPRGPARACAPHRSPRVAHAACVAPSGLWWCGALFGLVMWCPCPSRAACPTPHTGCGRRAVGLRQAHRRTPCSGGLQLTADLHTQSAWHKRTARPCLGPAVRALCLRIVYLGRLASPHRAFASCGPTTPRHRALASCFRIVPSRRAPRPTGLTASCLRIVRAHHTEGERDRGNDKGMA